MSIHIRKCQYDALIRLDEEPKDIVEYLLKKFLNEEHGIFQDPRKSIAHAQELVDEEPETPELTADMIIGRIMWENDELTADAVDQLIDAEIQRSGGLLTYDAAARVVAMNLGVELEPQQAGGSPTPFIVA